ncbi:MAG: cobalt transporter CbiM [Anaerolineaceae bacterium]|nr:cobalt transporter CbiM [Anaerolineaceae bacterium]
MQKPKQVRRNQGFYRLYYVALFVWLSTTAMHIPDGYLSPLTAVVMFLLVLPFWIRGTQRLKKTASAQNIPVIALLASFSFILMMFNFPLPGGTSGHAVGGALVAILLGPELAVMVISTALFIQALFFGDGGILALGANSINMAVVLPFVSYAIYQALAKNQEIRSRKRVVGAALGGWAGLTAAAALAGFEFGIQPMLFHSASGVPLYAPYPLKVAIPAMLLPHALVASVVEGAVTALVVAYLQKTNPSALEFGRPVSQMEPASFGDHRRWRALWVALVILAIITPIGLLAPGAAWGEWSSEELIRQGLGFVPQGLSQLSALWRAPLAGYDLPLLGNAALGYALSAVLGIGLISLLAWLFARYSGRGASSPHSPGHAGAIERTLIGISNALEQSIYAEQIANKAGVFQALDPRVKILFTLTAILATSLSKNLLVILSFACIVLFLARISAIPLGLFIKRVWLFMPFFTGVIALPAIFLTPGPALVTLPLGIVITQPGVLTALFLLLRVGTSVSLAGLLVLTTRWNSVLRAAGALGVPDVVLMVLGMTYRYVYMLLHLTNDVFLSRKSRLVGRLTGQQERQMLAASTGVLLSKSMHMSSEVYLAMQSRGFRGHSRGAANFRMQSYDWAVCGILILLAGAVIWLGG